MFDSECVCVLGYLLIQVRRARHAGHCWRSKDELLSDVLLWTLTYGQAKAGRPARTYIQQLCEDTGCNPEDLPEAMNDREKWRERVRDIRATSAIWWWWCVLKRIFSYLFLREFVYECGYMLACMCSCTFAEIHIQVVLLMCVSVYMYSCTNVCVPTCAFRCLWTCVCVSLCVCIRMFRFLCLMAYQPL